MKKMSIAICCLLCSNPVFAQPQSSNPFYPYYPDNVEYRFEKASLDQLSKDKKVVVINLKSPIEGEKKVTIMSWGNDHVLLSSNGYKVIKSLGELGKIYTGEALVPNVPPPPLAVNNPIQEIPISSLGEDARVVAQYALKNSTDKDLDISIGSTSCGCTSASLEKKHLEVGESTTLTATMSASDERLVNIDVVTSDTVQPHILLALHSLNTYSPFEMPSPIGLFAQKGQSTTAHTQFVLPARWKITHVKTSPSWLQAQLRELPGQPDVGRENILPGYTLDTTVPTQAPGGVIKGEVRIEFHDSPLSSVTIPVTGFVIDDINASPGMVVLNESPSGMARRTVIVHGPRDFSIKSISSNLKDFKANYEKSIVARAHAIELIIPVEGIKGSAFHQSVSIHLSDGRELPIDIDGTIGEGKLPMIAQGVTLNMPAPQFSAKDDKGKWDSLRLYKGKYNILLTFFPHCFTGGCESHLSSLRDSTQAIEATNTRVLAVSNDNIKEIKSFAKKLRLKFPVICDSGRDVSTKYGAVQTKTDYPSRLSFLIDKEGVVRWIDTDVNVVTHGADVLAKIYELGLDK